MPDQDPKSTLPTVGCLLLGVILISGCLSSCFWFLRWSEGYYEIKTIDCGNNREIVITAAVAWEIAQPIFYLVRVDGEIVVPATYIGDINPDDDPYSIRFSKFATPDGKLVGITYAQDTSNYLIIHDFSNNASFPRGDHIKWDSSLNFDENRNLRDQARTKLENKLNAAR